MNQLNEIARAAAIAAIDAPQYQHKPLLAASVYRNAGKHDIMLQNNGMLAGSPVYFVCVKAESTWAMYYTNCHRSPEHIAENGFKASAGQVQQLIEVEGELMEHYRK